MSNTAQHHINFVGVRRIGYIVSVVLLLISLGAVVLSNGIRYGVDFAGGVAIQLQLQPPVPDEQLKQVLDNAGLKGLSVQRYGEGEDSYLVRFTAEGTMASSELQDFMTQTLSASLPDQEITVVRTESVGPKVGEDLRNSALEALYYVVILITVYISGRFEQRWAMAALMAAALSACMYGLSFAGVPLGLRVPAVLLATLAICWKLKLSFALGALIGLLHDILITVGILTLLGKEFDLNIVAALLTLIGYSLNDTIIIYDRIRENLRNEPQDSQIHIGDIINLSLNQTLSRTILTSATTLAAILCLYFFGGGIIHDFALTMLMGVVIGTFSTVFVSSPILMAFGDTRFYANMVHKEDYEAPGEHGMV